MVHSDRDLTILFLWNSLS